MVGRRGSHSVIFSAQDGWSRKRQCLLLDSSVVCLTVRFISEHVSTSNHSSTKRVFCYNVQCGTNVNETVSRASAAQPVECLSILNSSPTNACMQVCGWNGLAAMLAAKSSAGVTPEVNLRNPLHTGDEAFKRGNPPWLWNPGQTGQMSPEVQNRSISGPTRKTYVYNFFLKE